MVNLDHGLHLFGSRDHGNTWSLLDTEVQPANESKVVELNDGRWMINSRVNGTGMRYSHMSTDQGETWETMPESSLIDPGCNGSIIRYTSVDADYRKNRLLFSNAASPNSRENMTVRISYDEGKTWSQGKTIYSGSSAYSSLTVLESGEIGLFYEKDNYTQNVFTRFTLDWLTDGEDRLIRTRTIE
jgi:sialidase-1